VLAAVMPEFGGTSVHVGRPVVVKRRVGSFMAMKVRFVSWRWWSRCAMHFLPRMVFIMEVVVGVLEAVL
jgi:hypothetical protein